MVIFWNSLLDKCENIKIVFFIFWLSNSDYLNY